MRFPVHLIVLIAVHAPACAEPVSGFEFLGEANRRMQLDEFANPGYLWVDAGRSLFFEAGNGKACSECHTVESMKGVAPGFPKYDADRNALIDLAGQINECRVERQRSSALARESEPMLSLLTWLGFLSRGQAIRVDLSDETLEYFEKGRAFYYQRRGQLNLSCAQCHEQSAGKRLRGELISEGHSNGYPAYRHIWETLGSIHRMFQWCNEAVRARPLPMGSRQYINLEYYLKWRGNGLKVETPAVRR